MVVGLSVGWCKVIFLLNPTPVRFTRGCAEGRSEHCKLLQLNNREALWMGRQDFTTEATEKYEDCRQMSEYMRNTGVVPEI